VPLQTPSLVPPEELERILTALSQQYGIAAGAEITLEADPGTFDLKRLLQYKQLGVARISMGVQSFQQVGQQGSRFWRGGG
jgi:oxygen-independent coproporphyrinogen-3 oxidase